MASENGDEVLRATGLSSATEAGFLAEKAAGNTAYKEGRFADAITHYTLAEDINPVSPLPPANRALVHLKLGSFAAAAADVTVALALQDAAPRTDGYQALRVKLLLRRASARKGLSMLERAARDFADVLELEPRNRDAERELRTLRNQHGVVPRPLSRTPPSQPRVTVVESAEEVHDTRVGANRGGANGVELNGKSNSRLSQKRAGENGLVHDFPLMRISDSVVKSLTSKWAETPPGNAFEFERAWKSLRGSETDRAKYLVLVGEERILRGLLGHSLTAQLLHEFVVALMQGEFENTQYCEEATRVMHALTRIPRFNLAVMLMSANERKDVIALLAKFEQHGVVREKLDELRKGFELL